jgi:hypothetical protein
MDAAQPEGYCGAPQHIQDEVIRRQALERRKSEMRNFVQFQVGLKLVEENRREPEKA